MVTESILCTLIHTIESKIMEEYTVYWYHLKEHSNPHSDGYVGITNNLERRHNEHIRNSNNLTTHFYNALGKYKELVTRDTLHICSKEDALALEYYYRPDTNIGWNVATGGEDTISSVQSVEISMYHKDNPQEILKFKSASEAARQLGLPSGRIRQARYRGKSLYGFDGWAILFDDTFDTSTTLTVQEDISNRLTGLKKTVPSHFKGTTNRWTDEQKANIGSYHKGKTISKEHIESMSKKLRETSSRCKSITLVHKEDENKKYTYHSLSEAARQLDMPLPRLKSKAQRPLNRFGKDGWAITSLGSE
jgi:predicted GIY-YIG superfamily endonuclease